MSRAGSPGEYPMMSSVQMKAGESCVFGDVGGRWRRWRVFVAVVDGVGGMAGEI